jgi:hypothetical protein
VVYCPVCAHTTSFTSCVMVLFHYEYEAPGINSTIYLWRFVLSVREVIDINVACHYRNTLENRLYVLTGTQFDTMVMLSCNFISMWSIHHFRFYHRLQSIVYLRMNLFQSTDSIHFPYKRAYNINQLKRNNARFCRVSSNQNDWYQPWEP